MDVVLYITFVIAGMSGGFFGIAVAAAFCGVVPKRPSIQNFAISQIAAVLYIIAALAYIHLGVIPYVVMGVGSLSTYGIYFVYRASCKSS
ncbi:MAG: hypothetical protein G01um101448_747 [Parcubacteria group bacterium Gr01-1014_48]|nr:MAG: hypothetical protein Greene041614_540 [Parcubacteria group bacterium Greene0416_14]TSC73479.1 MAG: hypothetical protein G01um101448_747 [Parcubacteria group bacterium Gr01-1014_48]TSD00554.1 MAG: hypothetical protein Greene101415_775 [Parcubacteria group bacterium Greene1014_15]TSD08247.1 MAG: hypothetical protein Greene07144_229 [Parcubacteria group bacterium Greene0714_4]